MLGDGIRALSLHHPNWARGFGVAALVPFVVVGLILRAAFLTASVVMVTGGCMVVPRSGAVRWYHSRGCTVIPRSGAVRWYHVQGLYGDTTLGAVRWYHARGLYGGTTLGGCTVVPRSGTV